MASLDVKVRIDRVTDALNDKGFADIYASHYDNTPSRLIVLHDDHGQLAHVEDETLIRVIEDSDDVAGLWTALGHSGMIGRVDATRS
jgi:transcriptional/translational regulatory protein YebC/TACO1